MKTFRQYLKESAEVKVVDGGSGKSYYQTSDVEDAKSWAKENVNKLHRPLKVVSGYTKHAEFEPRNIIKEDSDSYEEYVLIGYDRYHDVVRDMILDAKDQYSAKAQAKKKVDEYEKSGWDDEDLSWELEWQLVSKKNGDVLRSKVLARF